MTAAQHRKNLAGHLRDTTHRWHLWDVYRDFLELAALSVANALLPDEAREQRYLACIARYTPDEAARFPKMLANLEHDFMFMTPFSPPLPLPSPRVLISVVS